MSMVLQLHMIQDADTSNKDKQESFLIFDDTNFGDDEEAELKRKVCLIPVRQIYFCVKLITFMFCSALKCSASSSIGVYL